MPEGCQPAREANAQWTGHLSCYIFNYYN